MVFKEIVILVRNHLIRLDVQLQMYNNTVLCNTIHFVKIAIIGQRVFLHDMNYELMEMIQ